MFLIKICQICDEVLGQIELDDLTQELPDSIMNVTGNIAHALCPDCKDELEMEDYIRLN
ncbi:MAG: hypothetical protein GX958_07300 [Desulfitobacterium sp.]|nr:hypothetical protein [Desulfitobacterium sp.]